MSGSTKVVVGEGKYTWTVSPGGKMSCARYGEPWIEDFAAPGENAVMALIFDLESARESLRELTDRLELLKSELTAHSDRFSPDRYFGGDED